MGILIVSPHTSTVYSHHKNIQFTTVYR